MGVKLITSKYNDDKLLRFIESTLLDRTNYIRFNETVCNNIINKNVATDYTGKTVVVSDYSTRMMDKQPNLKYIRVLIYLLKVRRNINCNVVLIGVDKEYWNPAVKGYIEEVYYI